MGVVHGLAGTGTLVVLLATTAPTVGTGLSLLLAFAGVSIATMGTLAALWGRFLTTTASRALQGAAGVVSIAVGGLLLANELFGVELLGHGHGYEHHHSHGHDHGHAHVHEYVPVVGDDAGSVLEFALALPPTI